MNNRICSSNTYSSNSDSMRNVLLLAMVIVMVVARKIVVMISFLKVYSALFRVD